MNIKSKKHLNKLSYYGIFIFCSSFLCTKAYSQDIHKQQYSLEINVSPITTSHIGPLKDLIGGPGHEGKNYFGLSAKVSYSLTEKWSLATGIGYSTQKAVTVLPYDGSPGKEKIITQKLHVWEVPLEVKYNLSKYFFTYAGPLVHFQQKELYGLDKQSGIGAQIGIGVQIPLSNRFSISASPSYKMYSLIPFHTNSHYDRMQLLGVNLGLKYAL